MSVPPPPTPRHRAGKVSLLFGLSYTMESALCLWDSVCWSITTMSPSGDILCMLIWRLSEGFSSGDYYLASFLENFLTIILLKIVSLYFLFLRLLLDVNVVAFNLLIFLTFFFFWYFSSLYVFVLFWVLSSENLPIHWFSFQLYLVYCLTHPFLECLHDLLSVSTPTYKVLFSSLFEHFK